MDLARLQTSSWLVPHLPLAFSVPAAVFSPGYDFSVVQGPAQFWVSPYHAVTVSVPASLKPVFLPEISPLWVGQSPVFLPPLCLVFLLYETAVFVVFYGVRP